MTAAGLRVPVARALRRMVTHPAVKSVKVTMEGGVTFATVELATQLPSRWQAQGVSENGVRAVEPVTVRFDEQFPATAPKFFLRPDFDRSHPHIQQNPNDDPPEPCLAAVPVAELYRVQGMHGLLDQLVLWLERAARVELIAFEQGWEPVRRDHFDDVVVADADWLHTLPKRHAEAPAFEAGFTAFVKRSGSLYAVVVRDSRTPLRLNLTQDLAKDPSRTFCIIAWSGKLPPGAPFVAGHYEPETVRDVAGLHRRAHALGSGPELASTLQLLQSRVRGWGFTKPVPLAVIILARRPCAVIGQQSPWELIPYIVELSGNDDLSPGSMKPVRIAMHRQTIGPKLLHRATGGGTEQLRKPWTLLGCGSVGSKLALHLTREGQGPSHVIDKAWMAPHNYARHALLPMGPNEGMGLLPKSLLQAHGIRRFGQPVEYYDIDVVEEKLPKAAISAEVGVLVNATGSLAVREALGRGDARPRVAESCLLALGRIAYLSLEGPDSNPSTIDLATESYRLFLSDPRVSRSVFETAPTEIAIGQGCASLTLPIPDARLSAMTAPMASRIASWQAGGLPRTAGYIAIGELQDDGMSQTWNEYQVPPWVIVGNRSGAATVRLSSHAHRRITEEVAARPGVETGSILIGRWSETGSTFHVVDVLSAPADSEFSSGLFVLGMEGVSAVVADIVTRSQGALYPLGTWHNHLADSGPSRLDRHTAQMLAHQQQLPVLLLIHMPGGGYRFLTAESLALPVVSSESSANG